MGNIKDAQDTLSLMQDALRCYSNQKQNDAISSKFKVVDWDYVKTTVDLTKNVKYSIE